MRLKPIFYCDAKYLALGFGVGQCPQRQNLALGTPTCWYLGANGNPFCVLPDAFNPTRNLKFAFYPTRNPNASQWNIGCVGSLVLGLCVGHVHFICFVLISFALGGRRKHSFQWNMGFNNCNARLCSRLSNLAFSCIDEIENWSHSFTLKHVRSASFCIT